MSLWPTTPEQLTARTAKKIWFPSPESPFPATPLVRCHVSFRGCIGDNILGKSQLQTINILTYTCKCIFVQLRFYKKLRVNTSSKLGVFLGTCPVGFGHFESRDALDISSLPIFRVATTFPTLFNQLTLQQHLELQQLGISRKTTPNRLRKKHIPMTDPWDERYIYLHFHGFHVVCFSCR